MPVSRRQRRPKIGCEVLAQLKSHDATRTQQIIERVVQGFDKYSKDVAAYRSAKELLLDAVDEYINE